MSEGRRLPQTAAAAGRLVHGDLIILEKQEVRGQIFKILQNKLGRVGSFLRARISDLSVIFFFFTFILQFKCLI